MVVLPHAGYTALSWAHGENEDTHLGLPTAPRPVPCPPAGAGLSTTHSSSRPPWSAHLAAHVDTEAENPFTGGMGTRQPEGDCPQGVQWPAGP